MCGYTGKGVHTAGYVLRRFLHPLGRVARDEEKRAQPQAGRRWIRAERRHWQTTSSRWLTSRCVKVTMPAFGRDLLGFNSVTSVSARSVSPMQPGLGITTLSKSEARPAGKQWVRAGKLRGL